MEQTIKQHATGSTMCPVHALAHIVYDILATGGDEYNLLCLVAKYGDWIPVEIHHIIAAVRAKSKNLNLNLQSIDPDLVRANYLHAGGAMVLKLHGYDNTTIMKMGRWTYLTLLQIYTKPDCPPLVGYITKMSMPIPFVNMEAIYL